MSRWQSFLFDRMVGVLRFGLFLYFKVMHRLELRGKENIPQSGPVILAPNHQTSYDGPLVGFVISRHVYCMVMASYFKLPVIGFLLRTFRGIPIAGPRDRVAYQRMLDTLKRGDVVVIFPEGHRTRDGRMMKLQVGAARAALTTGATIVPVSVLGAYEAWPRHRTLPRPFHKIVVQYHPPIHCESVPRALLKERAEEVTQQLDAVLRPPVDAWWRQSK